MVLGGDGCIEGGFGCDGRLAEREVMEWWRFQEGTMTRMLLRCCECVVSNQEVDGSLEKKVEVEVEFGSENDSGDEVSE